jgi:hypothetical protein
VVEVSVVMEPLLVLTELPIQVEVVVVADIKILQRYLPVVAQVVRASLYYAILVVNVLQAEMR